SSTLFYLTNKFKPLRYVGKTAKYIGKHGTEAVGLTIIMRLDFGRSSCHLAANVPALCEVAD
ncbi:hypothetical protein CHU92_09155, partial [Flavobacterium cyanobacteriorum]